MRAILQLNPQDINEQLLQTLRQLMLSGSHALRGNRLRDALASRIKHTGR